MTRTLILSFEGDHPHELDFVLKEDDTVIDQGRLGIGELAARIPALEALSATVIVPGEFVTSHGVTPPPGSHRHLQRVLPYLLEDDIAAPPESVHIAATAQPDGDNLLALVVDRALLRQWLETLETAGVRCVRMLPDYLLLEETGRTVVAQGAGRRLVRFPDGSGAALPETLMDRFTTEEFDRVEQPNLNAASTASGNLLLGEFRPRRKDDAMGYLKPFAWAATILLAVHLSYFLLTGLYYAQRADEIHAEALRFFHTHFPAETRVVNIRRQLEGLMQTVTPAGGVDTLLDLVSAIALAGAPDRLPGSRIRHLNFDSQEQALRVEMDIANLADLQLLGNWLAEQGFAMELMGAGENQGRVNARLEISRGRRL